jgi:quercetin dioxygenase-like cupin family protein
MEIKRAGTEPSGRGPAEYFTGNVRVDPLCNPPAPARVSMALVTFEPGARTTWHTHPLGQTLIVTAGCGRVQREDEPVQEIRPGDVVWDRARRTPLARRRAANRDEPYRRARATGRFRRDLDGTRY